MTIEEILELWKNDAPINQLDLSESTRQIPNLHAKYYEIYVHEKVHLLKLRSLWKKLKFEKQEFLINPTQDGFDRGWQFPERGKPLRNEISTFVEADNDVLKVELNVGMQEEKVELLKDILKSIHSRNFIIRNLLEDRKFMSGDS